MRRKKLNFMLKKDKLMQIYKVSAYCGIHTAKEQ